MSVPVALLCEANRPLDARSYGSENRVTLSSDTDLNSIHGLVRYDTTNNLLYVNCNGTFKTLLTTTDTDADAASYDLVSKHEILEGRVLALEGAIPDTLTFNNFDGSDTHAEYSVAFADSANNAINKFQFVRAPGQQPFPLFLRAQNATFDLFVVSSIGDLKLEPGVQYSVDASPTATGDYYYKAVQVFTTAASIVLRIEYAITTP